MDILTLLIIVTQDDDTIVFPLGVTLVESENDSIGDSSLVQGQRMIVLEILH